MSSGAVRPVAHRWSRTERYRGGCIAWCTCGVGSPVKATPDEANAALQRHLDNPALLPR